MYEEKHLKFIREVRKELDKDSPNIEDIIIKAERSHEQLSFDFDKAKLKSEYSKFKAMTDVWAAARYAKDHEPNWGVKEKVYLPPTKEERQEQLQHLYPESRKDIRKMNARQTKWAFLNIITYQKKAKSILNR